MWMDEMVNIKNEEERLFSKALFHTVIKFANNIRVFIFLFYFKLKITNKLPNRRENVKRALYF